MTAPQAPLNEPRKPPYKLAGFVLLLVAAIAAVLVWFQFRGGFTPKEQLTMLSSRSGLSMDPGVEGDLQRRPDRSGGRIEEVNVGGEPKAKITLDVDPKYIDLIPANVVADIKATTVFGNKYVSFSSPENPCTATDYQYPT